MKIINSISDLLLQIWNIYFTTMLDFSAAHPVLAPIVFLIVTVCLIRIGIALHARIQKSLQKIFDIKGIKKQIDKPLWFSKYISALIENILLFPIKVYFYLKVKRIAYKYKK